nr:MAG TPA: TMEM119 family [Caudoviricetes sp.]
MFQNVKKKLKENILSILLVWVFFFFMFFIFISNIYTFI